MLFAGYIVHRNYEILIKRISNAIAPMLRSATSCGTKHRSKFTDVRRKAYNYSGMDGGTNEKVTS